MIASRPSSARGHLRQFGVVVIVSFLLPVPAAFLHEPEAHDVFQEPDLAADASLVGVVVAECFVIDDGLIELDAHQRPGAGADVAPVAGALGGNGSDGAGGIVAGGRDHRNRAIHAAFNRHRLAQRAEHRPRGDDLGKEAERNSQPGQQVGGPGLFPRIVHLAGRDDREFALGDAGEEVIEQVRHEEQRLRRCDQLRRLLHGGDELKERVDLHELNAGRLENFLPAHFAKRALEDSLGAGVAVVEGKAEDFSVAAEQSIIDAPGVDADAVDCRPCARRIRQQRFAQAGLELFPLGEKVPVQMAVHPAGGIGKAMLFLKGEDAFGEMAHNGPSTLCSHIKREKIPGRHSEFSIKGIGGILTGRWIRGKPLCLAV